MAPLPGRVGVEQRERSLLGQRVARLGCYLLVLLSSAHLGVGRIRPAGRVHLGRQVAELLGVGLRGLHHAPLRLSADALRLIFRRSAQVRGLRLPSQKPHREAGYVSRARSCKGAPPSLSSPLLLRTRPPPCAFAFPLSLRVDHERSCSRPATIGAAHPHALHFSLWIFSRNKLATPQWPHAGQRTSSVVGYRLISTGWPSASV